MRGLAVHLSIIPLTALTILMVEALAMVIDVEPPKKFFNICYGIMWFYGAFSFLILLSLWSGS